MSDSTQLMLSLTLLGRPQILIDGEPFTQLNSNKAQALLYYLAMTGQSHTRQSLAALLWTDIAENRARGNLRVELSRLTKQAHLNQYLMAKRQTIALRQDLYLELDVAQFEAHLSDPERTTAQMQAAVDLYTGDFMAEFQLRDAPMFEEWMFGERERLRQLFLRSLYELSLRQTEERQYQVAIKSASRLVADEPTVEEGHRQLMLLYALTGQRGLALAQYETCYTILEDELGVSPSDEFLALYDRIVDNEITPDQDHMMMVPTAELPPPFQAPPQLFHFVGREHEIVKLETILRESLLHRTPSNTAIHRNGLGKSLDHAHARQPISSSQTQPRLSPIYALVGMGGVGKTALAQQMAHDLQNTFVDGVLWARVDTSDPMNILERWAAAFGYDFSRISEPDERAQAFHRVLAEKRVLVILDDVTSLAKARLLLPTSDSCAVLMTTRNVDIATALHAHIIHLGELTPVESKELLVRILGESRVDAEPEAADTICELLQHLPLAVEITAQRLLSRPKRRLDAMAARLRHVQERLNLGIQDSAVRSSFMVSWEALDTRLRDTFLLLGVFEGRSFGAEALASVANLDVYTIEDHLFELTTLSLITEEHNERYRQHTLLADFAREKLGDSKKHEQSQLRMATYYQGFANQHAANYIALRPEWENMMAGMESAYQLRQWALVLHYTESLDDAWFARSRFAEARRGYGWAREAAHALQNEEALTDCLLHEARVCIEQNQYDEAEALLSESLQLYEKLGELSGIADAKYQLARILLEQSNYPEAEILLNESQSIKEQVGDVEGVALTLYSQARIFSHRGENDAADDLAQQALAMQESAQDRRSSLQTLRVLMGTAIRSGNYELAQSYGERALASCHELQDQGELAATLYSVSTIYRSQREFENALSYAQESMILGERVGDRKLQGQIFYELSVIHEGLHQYEAALETALRSVDLLQELHDRHTIVFTLVHIGDLYYSRLNQPKEAHKTWKSALEIAEPQAHPLSEPLQYRIAQITSL